MSGRRSTPCWLRSAEGTVTTEGRGTSEVRAQGSARSGEGLVARRPGGRGSPTGTVGGEGVCCLCFGELRTFSSSALRCSPLHWPPFRFPYNSVFGKRYPSSHRGVMEHQGQFKIFSVMILHVGHGFTFCVEILAWLSGKKLLAVEKADLYIGKITMSSLVVI